MIQLQQTTLLSILMALVNVSTTNDAEIIGSNVFAVRGQSLALFCNTESHHEETLWLHDGRIIAQNNVTAGNGSMRLSINAPTPTESSLIISDFLEEDAGVYECVAPNTVLATYIVKMVEGYELVGTSSTVEPLTMSARKGYGTSTKTDNNGARCQHIIIAPFVLTLSHILLTAVNI